MRTRLVSTAITVLAFATPVFVPAGAQAQLGTSAWSLEIGTDVGTSDEFSFGVRRHSGARSAFRFAIEADVDKEDGEGERFSTGFPDLDAEVFTDLHALGLAVHWMRFAEIRDDLSATFATGPMVRSVRNSFRQGTGQGTASFSEFEFRDSEMTFGWEILLGAEWFFTRRLSLGGSAGFRGEIGSGDNVQVSRSGTGATYDVTQTQLETDIARLSTRSGRILLSAYF